MPTPGDWVLLAYRMPREPSTARIAVWRKLRRLGVVQVVDGLVGLPADARTKEQLEWIADEVTAGGGEAFLWSARPTTRAQERTLAARMADEVDARYDAVVNEAVEASSSLDEATRRRTLTRLEREVRRIRLRDHFPRRGYEQAHEAMSHLAETIDGHRKASRP